MTKIFSPDVYQAALKLLGMTLMTDAEGNPLPAAQMSPDVLLAARQIQDKVEEEQVSMISTDAVAPVEVAKQAPTGVTLQPVSQLPVAGAYAQPIQPWDQKATVRKVKDVFRIADAPDQAQVEVFERVEDPRVPYAKKDPRYVWRKDVFAPLAAFMFDNDGDTLQIAGPHGSGKTSGVVQYCAYVGRPVICVNGRKGMEVSDLLGDPQPQPDGSWKWVDGALTKAVRHGYVFILNEAFLTTPGELTGLNDVAEGHPLCLVRNGGEIVHPHPQFRLVLTDNSGGQGDQTGFYSGVVTQNPSFLDRSCKMFVGYPDADIERSVLEGKLEGTGFELDSAVIDKFVATANDVRAVFMGDASKSKVELTVTMSTRTLWRWLLRSFHMAKVDEKTGSPVLGIAAALDFALTRTIDQSERKAIHEIARGHFGKVWKDADGVQTDGA